MKLLTKLKNIEDLIKANHLEAALNKIKDLVSEDPFPFPILEQFISGENSDFNKLFAHLLEFEKYHLDVEYCEENLEASHLLDNVIAYCYEKGLKTEADLLDSFYSISFDTFLTLYGPLQETLAFIQANESLSLTSELKADLNQAIEAIKALKDYECYLIPLED